MKFRSSYIWAALVALGAAGWMASGMLGGNAGPPEATSAQQANSSEVEVSATSSVNSSAATASKPIISSVIVENSKVRRSVRASGVTQPKAIITLSAEISGTARKVPAVEGRQVEAGDILVVIDTSTLPARIEAAKRKSRRPLRRWTAPWLSLAAPIMSSVPPPRPISRWQGSA